MYEKCVQTCEGFISWELANQAKEKCATEVHIMKDSGMRNSFRHAT